MTDKTVGLLFIATWLASMAYPWHPSLPKARLLVHTPWLLIALWAWYESVMPNSMNIRLDIPLIILALAAAFFVYLIRIILFWWIGRKAAR